MFIGINSTNRRRVLRTALMAMRDGPDMLSQDDRAEVDSLLREINAAENLGKLPPTHDTPQPTHYGDR